jgi:transcriptional regulator with XRE-family HTH domain
VKGTQLKEARLVASCTQQEAARKLGVTQAYLSMLERGTRPVSNGLASRVAERFDVPATALPLGECETDCNERKRRRNDDSFFASALGALGYGGFSHLRGASKSNPASLLMEALDCDDLDPRITEGLPW